MTAYAAKWSEVHGQGGAITAAALATDRSRPLSAATSSADLDRAAGPLVLDGTPTRHSVPLDCVGDTGDLLLKPALELDTHRSGGGVRGIRSVGLVGKATCGTP